MYLVLEELFVDKNRIRDCHKGESINLEWFNDIEAEVVAYLVAVELLEQVVCVQEVEHNHPMEALVDAVLGNPPMVAPVAAPASHVASLAAVENNLRTAVLDDAVQGNLLRVVLVAAVDEGRTEAAASHAAPLGAVEAAHVAYPSVVVAAASHAAEKAYCPVVLAASAAVVLVAVHNCSAGRKVQAVPFLAVAHEEEAYCPGGLVPFHRHLLDSLQTP